MTSVVRSVANWFGSSSESDVTVPDPYTQTQTSNPALDTGSADVIEHPGNKQLDAERTTVKDTRLAMEEDLLEVSMQAIQTAKDWGNYLYSLGKFTGKEVTKTAGQLKAALEGTIFSDDGSAEGDDVTEGSDNSKTSEATVAPWVGYNEEEVMKSQILGLSKEKRNFTCNPPSGVEFYFDYNVSYPVARIMLDEDPSLKMMRFELVPKQVREETFWRNYFYRVALIKQSAQLTSLAKHTDNDSSCVVVSDDMYQVEQCKVTSKCSNDALNAESVDKTTAPQHFNATSMKDEELDNIPDWDEELDLELDEFELVDVADIG